MSQSVPLVLIGGALAMSYASRHLFNDPYHSTLYSGSGGSSHFWHGGGFFGGSGGGSYGGSSGRSSGGSFHSGGFGSSGHASGGG